MPRARAILQSEFPYNLGGRCINREWFQIPMDAVWEIFCTELRKVHDDEGLRIHSFVLMSNHFHLIASTPEANISRCMMLMMKRVSSRLTQAGNRINETFAGRHYKTVLSDPSYFLNAYKYNYRNPINAQICENAEDYPYSTLAGILKVQPLLLPVIDTTLECDRLGTLKWLNTAPDPKKQEAVKYALKRPVFKSKLCPSSRKPILREGEII